MKKYRTTRFGRRHALVARLPLAAAIHLAFLAPVFAADADQDATTTTTAPRTAAKEKTSQLQTITVTAQKRSENEQTVPISMNVLSTDTLQQMNVKNLDDYVKLLPSVAIQNLYLGFSQVYMRGVASGSNGNHSGPLPSVGMYLDEQPITTIQGALDMNIYDVERVEALAGPQGTLYGASSESGTIRIITNKPDPSAFSASASAELNTIDHGGIGYVTEGYVNLPISSNAALRMVGWSKTDAGYIDNVYGTRTYTGTYPDGVGPPLAGTPIPPITVNNADRVKDHYNDADTRGGRAALKVDLNEDWSIMPTVAGQTQHANGINAFDPGVGDLKLTHFFPENFDDRWVQAALTVKGKIGNFDLTYAVAHLNRDDHYSQDYSDYAFWYDTLAGYGAYIHDNNGNLINPAQHIIGIDKYRKTSNELRISSPAENRLRFVAGVFDEVQSHNINQQYIIQGLGSDLSVTGWPNTLWLTQQDRKDNDYAAFGEVNYDFTDKLTATVGARRYHTDNGLKGFYGFSAGYSSSQGEATCFTPLAPFEGAPCMDLDKDTKEDGTLGKVNFTYKIDADRMIYATWSQGFRPGGINRRGTLPPYKSDSLDNYEFGWKTQWLDHHLLWNGAVFQENWKNFQFSLLGQNGLTEIRNANNARIRGLETSLGWAVTYNLTLTAGLALYDAVLTENYCGTTDANDQPVTNCADPQAPSGTRLPLTAKEKGNLTARYSFDFHGMDSYLQAAGFFEGRRGTDLRIAENAIIGDMPGYGTVDLSAGFKKNLWSFDFYLKNAFDNRGQLARYAECAIDTCGAQTYIVPVQPRTIGFRVTRDF
ncbi:MAG: TonB-dependent receptor [Proteobacteria bacterium]|nr:TonB-dependent receptor [Pseudomonadota bacterium]